MKNAISEVAKENPNEQMYAGQPARPGKGLNGLGVELGSREFGLRVLGAGSGHAGLASNGQADRCMPGSLNNPQSNL
jgi:hypothetical protein